MTIRVNGREMEFAGGSVQDLLEALKLAGKNIVVEKNGAIVHRERYGAEPVSEGDAYEMVRLVGGG